MPICVTLRQHTEGDRPTDRSIEPQVSGIGWSHAVTIRERESTGDDSHSDFEGGNPREALTPPRPSGQTHDGWEEARAPCW
ncbi:hypothetical protein chiPu_0024159 [Chiloscyllium punctatum]|uniref:Uncharacterized protein n=1 Tax=Chiloscyllium punctatum TaxID=137246 RepID=A0A401TBV6_CHIPU|nr:hypothetical protein [Chiloscyllium punctatum]